MRLIRLLLLHVSLCVSLASSIVFFTNPLSASAQNAINASSETLAVVDKSVIRKAEVERIAAGRPQVYADLPSDIRQERIIDLLLSEYMVDYFYGQNTQGLSPLVLEAIDDARRQILLQFFVQSQFTPPKVTNAQVMKFIEDNPQLFIDRRSYKFAHVKLSGGTREARQIAQDYLQSKLDSQGVDIALLEALIAKLQIDGVVATLDTAWQPSEALSIDILSRLDKLAHDNQVIDIKEIPNATSILLLKSYAPIRVDPNQVRKTIELKIIAEAFDLHREVTIRRIASTASVSPAASDDPQTKAFYTSFAQEGKTAGRPSISLSVTLVGLYCTGAFGTLIGYFIWIWLRLKLIYRRQLMDDLGIFSSALGHSLAIPFSLGVLLALLTSASAAALVTMQSFGETTTYITLFSGTATSLAIAGLWHHRSKYLASRTADENGAKYENAEPARRILALKKNHGKPLATAIGLSVVYCISITLALTSPTSLS